MGALKPRDKAAERDAEWEVYMKHLSDLKNDTSNMHSDLASNNDGAYDSD